MRLPEMHALGRRRHGDPRPAVRPRAMPASFQEAPRRRAHAAHTARASRGRRVEKLEDQYPFDDE
jgi:hypothetical protein